MIVTKRALGGRTPTSFHKGKVLRHTVDSSTLRNWVLSNENVTFTFIEDSATGVSLNSWSHAEFTETVTNDAKSLWSMGVIRDYKNAGTAGSVYYNTYVITPKAGQFTGPSLLPVDTGSAKTFTFTWENIAYDQKNPTYTCDVTVTASLPDGQDYLDLQVSCTANQAYSSADLTDFNSAVVSYLGFPSFALKKNSNETYNESTILASPVSIGYTYHNPHKYLRIPRFPAESFALKGNAERTFAAGQVGSPAPSIYKYNYGSPGFMSIPALVYGRKDIQEGTLFYAMDPDGTNPKGFQWYVDDSHLLIKTYHTSDHAIDPYGVGGYTSDTVPYSIENAPEWSMRIRPFKSPSTWVDWEGFKVYRDEAIPEQEAAGWLPKSFYERAQEGTLSKGASEVPMVLNTFGYTTGTFDSVTGASQLYRQLYTESVSPNVPEVAVIPTHYQCVTLNSTPKASTDPTAISATYNGWEPWAGSGIGVSYGPDAYKSPDFTHVNDNHTGGYQALVSDGNLLYNYTLFPYCIASGSEWTRTISGDDLRHKNVYDESELYTQEQYHTWASTPKEGVLFFSDFIACIDPPPSIEQYGKIGNMLGSYGASVYHDTAGVYGRGCFAKDHRYLDTGTNKEIIHTHPRGSFSRYFNRKHLNWWDAWHSGSQEGYRTGVLGADTTSYVNPISASDFALGNSSEFPCDRNLAHVPISLIYEPLGPIFDAYANEILDPRDDAIVNTVGGISVDAYTDAAVEAALALQPNLTHWSCKIEPPNWIQRCPAYQIAFGDRVIVNEWSAIYASNTYDLFFTNGVLTGKGTYGQALKGPNTGELQVQDWASFSTTRWPYTNRMSCWHVDSQYGNFVAAYSGVPQESGIFYSGLWSGYTDNVIQKQFRIQAYNPDYTYHGIFRHPLDVYSTETSIEATDTRSFRKAQLPNLRPTTGNFVDWGEDKVSHFVREHRDNGNLLIVIGHWSSGSNVPFSGTFDPTSYGIEEGYQVYDLDVNSTNHGTRTLDSIVEPGQPFAIDLSLDEYEYKVYEIETNGELLDNVLFSDLKTNYSPVRYSYDEQEITTSDLSMSYSYGSSTQGEIIPPQEGFRSPFTQQILNNLPQWMKMRQDYNSNGWMLTNSWGMALEKVLENSTEFTKNLNIVTAGTLPLTELGYIGIDSPELLEPTPPRNLLFNSSFAIKDVSRTKMPAGWQKFTANDDVHLSNVGSTVTSASIISSSGKIKIGQEVPMNNDLVTKMVASCYVLSDTGTVDIKLHVAVEKIDGTTTSAQAILTSRSSEWKRLVLPIDVDAQVYRVNLSVDTNCDGEVKISAPQLELSALSSWSKSPLDFLNYYPSLNNFNLVYKYSEGSMSTRLPIFPVPQEQEFLDAAIPSRVVAVAKPLIDLGDYVDQEFGRKVDQLEEVVRTEWAVVEDQVVERSVSPTIFDVFGRYDIKDLRYFEGLEYGTREETNVSIIPLTSAVRNGYLFVVCSETFENKTKHVLKIIKPRTPPNGETYLESIIDFDLDLNFDSLYQLDNQITEEVYSISFSDVDTKYMIITTTNNVKHYYKLYFDYYYVDGSKNRLYLIEDYNNSNIAVI